MNEVLHNILVLIDTGIISWAGGKMVLDFLWMKTVQFMCNNDMWSIPELQPVIDLIHRGL